MSGINVGKEYVNSLPKEFTYNDKKYHVMWGTALQQHNGEIGTIMIWPDGDYLYSASCADWKENFNSKNWQWEIMPNKDIANGNKYYRYRSNGWYMDHVAQEIKYDFNEIAKELEKYNSQKTNESVVKDVIERILAGVPVREVLNEAYKTANFVQTTKDLKNKSAGIKSDYATLLTQEQYNKYKSLLHKHPLDFTGWLKDGNSPDIGKFDIKLLAYPLAVQPVIHLSSVGDLKQGETFEYGGEDFVLLDNDFAISVSPIGKSEFRKEFDNEADAKDYEKSDVKKFVDAWFNKIKR